MQMQVGLNSKTLNFYAIVSINGYIQIQKMKMNTKVFLKFAFNVHYKVPSHNDSGT